LICFLDMDGVLVDLVGALVKYHDIKLWPYNIAENMGEYDLAKLLGMTQEELWLGCDRKFWATLPKMPDADEIVTILEKNFGQENITILTMPIDQDGCCDGKIDWIKANYPQFADNIMISSGGKKEVFANTDSILVDDRDKIIEKFSARGGYTVRVPRPWNRWWALKTIPVVEADLTAVKIAMEYSAVFGL